MSDINVYPEMNKTIKDIYSKSNEFEQQYVLTWIEQLESENEKLKETLNRIRLAAASPGRTFNQRLLDIEKLVRGESNE